MESVLPPDPYLALGVPKDANPADIKATYRKLVLKCHPDKIQNEAAKQEAADKFHRIQTAYEIVGDEDRRARYDAQVKLAELRKDVMERGGPGARGGVDVRTAGYKVPTESPRGGDFFARGPDRYTRMSPQYEPQYEERRPAAFSDEDYIDISPRPTSRKHDDYFDRPIKRSSPKEDPRKQKPSARDAKENERSSRKEKNRRTEKNLRRDRDRKNAYVEDESDSESDPYERARRRQRDTDDWEETLRQRAMYEEVTRRQTEEAANGVFFDERARKIFMQGTTAREHIERSNKPTRPRAEPERRPESERRPSPPERRPSPVRVNSSKEKMESTKRRDKSPPPIRRGFFRTKTTGRDTGKSPRDKDPKIEIVEEPREMRTNEPREARRPPTLNQSKSAPGEIRPPFERERSYSLQEDRQDDPIPQVKRSETMPAEHAAAAPRESRGRKDNRRPRPDPAYQTPDSPIDEPIPKVKRSETMATEHAPAPRDSRDSHGRRNSGRPRVETAYPTPDPTPEPERGHGYADDYEYATPDGFVIKNPDGYKTEVREPQTRTTRRSSPSPANARERQRPSSGKHSAPEPPPMPRTTSKQYVYPDREYSRPTPSRENSGRLWGEIPNPRSPKTFSYSPERENISMQPEIRPKDVKYQTGYIRRSSHMDEKPRYSRTNSGRQAVHA